MESSFVGRRVAIEMPPVRGGDGYAVVDQPGSVQHCDGVVVALVVSSLARDGDLKGG